MYIKKFKLDHNTINIYCINTMQYIYIFINKLACKTKSQFCATTLNYISINAPSFTCYIVFNKIVLLSMFKLIVLKLSIHTLLICFDHWWRQKKNVIIFYAFTSYYTLACKY